MSAETCQVVLRSHTKARAVVSIQSDSGISAVSKALGVNPVRIGVVVCPIQLLIQILGQIVGLPGAGIPGEETWDDAAGKGVQALDIGHVGAHVDQPALIERRSHLAVACTVGAFSGDPYLKAGVVNTLQPPIVPGPATRYPGIRAGFVELQYNAVRPDGLDRVAILLTARIVLAGLSELVRKTPRVHIVAVGADVHVPRRLRDARVVLGVQRQSPEAEFHSLLICALCLEAQAVPRGVVSQVIGMVYHSGERFVLTEPVANTPGLQRGQRPAIYESLKTHVRTRARPDLLNPVHPDIGHAYLCIEVVHFVRVVLLEVVCPAKQMAFGAVLRIVARKHGAIADMYPVYIDFSRVQRVHTALNRSGEDDCLDAIV